MKKSFKKIFISLFTAGIIFLNVKSIQASYLLYEKINSKPITKGVEYIESNQVTSNGLRDIHILKITTEDPNIKISNTVSIKDFNLKEKTSDLLNNKNAIAGVNGDFFNLKGTHSVSQGVTVVDGNLISTDHTNNLNKNEYAGFFVDKDGNQFFDYVKTDMQLEINNKEAINIYYYNKVPNMIYSAYIDGKSYSDTSVIDSNFKNITKVVVENNKITYISKKGELVKVPSNGYIILLSDEGADYYTTLLKIGDQVNFKFYSNINYENLYTAIGGGGKILSNGQVVSDSGFVVKGRQPRTAIGINKNKTEIILMVVDGRGNNGENIGVTHDELASLMLRYGVTDAIHLDGGGSSTMAIKKVGEENVEVINSLSDGVERRVINSVGIYNNSEVGEISDIIIEFPKKEIIKNSGTPYKIYGVDNYLSTIDLDLNNLILTSTDQQGVFKNGMFYPSVSGNIEITGTYKDITGKTNINSLEIIELIPNTNKINTSLGNKITLDFNGKNFNGDTSYIYDNLKYEIFPSDLGIIEGNIFTPLKDGVGYIKVSLENVVYYLDVTVGFKNQLVTSFEDVNNIKYENYPTNISGSVNPENNNPKTGTKAISLSYAFNETDITQGAYLSFVEKINLGNAKEIKISVAGDNSKNWLRGKIIDSNNKEYLIDLAKEINWEGYQDVTGIIPSNVKYPIYLDRIYVVTTNNTNITNYTLTFDDLEIKIPLDEKLEHPNSNSFYDSLRMNLNELYLENSYDITLAGNFKNFKEEKPEWYNTVQQNVVDTLAKNSSKVLFASGTDFIGTLEIPSLNYGTYYGFYNHNNTGIMYLNNSKGSFYNSNIEQWSNFHNDIKNKNEKNIIIETKLNPLNLKSSKEFELLHEELVNLKNEGRNIFFVSTEGTNNSVTVKNGIRYINMGGLFNEDDSINKEFSILRFRISNNEIFYNLEKVFN